MNEQGQIELLEKFIYLKNEYENLPQEKTANPYQFYVNNNALEPVSGEVLYCIIRHFKPKKIFEIGSGYSTYLSAQALLKNKEDGHKGELVAFEPYPNEILKAGFPGLSALVVKKIQDVPLKEFSKLGKNDLLFIDSTHVLKIGSDVQYEYLEILPRLNKGVIVHLHDIFLPAEYPKDLVVKYYKFWTEQYLLQAFLSFNSSFEVLWASSFMHLNHPDKLKKAFSSYKSSRWPSSFYLKKIK
jgi:predicted O-methyltransferase YrrM